MPKQEKPLSMQEEMLARHEDIKALVSTEEFGTQQPLKRIGEKIQVHDFTIDSGCNVFHWDDVVEALVHYKQPFSLTYRRLDGRTRFWQLTTGNHVIHVRACGYGTGDYLEFSEGFPEQLKFQVLRWLSQTHCMNQIQYYESKLDSEPRNEELKKLFVNMQENLVNALVKTRAMRFTLYDSVRTREDLDTLVEWVNARGSISTLKSLVKDAPNPPLITKKDQVVWHKELVRKEALVADASAEVVQAFLVHEEEIREAYDKELIS